MTTPRDIREVLKDFTEPIEVDMEEGDIVTDVVVLLRVQKLTDTYDELVIGTSDNTGGIVQYGLVCSAKLQLDDWMRKPDTDGD